MLSKFEEVNEKKIAYLIGFLAGDGAFNDGFGKRADRMSVTTTDMDVVNWISEHFEEYPIDNPRFVNNEARGIFAKQPSYLKTFGVIHSAFFNKYGILTKKEERTVCNISKANMRYFMLGLIDADGCLSYTIRKDRERVSAKVSINHPSLKMFEKIQEYLLSSLCIPSSIKPKGTEKCYVLSFSKIEHIEKFCEWLYSDKESIVLMRKYNNWKEFKQVVADKRNDGKCYPREFIDTDGYHSLIGSMGKYMYIVDGVEYPSLNIASKSTGIDRSLISSRCFQENFGYSRRPKTEEELKDYSSYVARQVKKLYNKWVEEQ